MPNDDAKCQISTIRRTHKKTNLRNCSAQPIRSGIHRRACHVSNYRMDDDDERKRRETPSHFDSTEVIGLFELCPEARQMV